MHIIIILATFTTDLLIKKWILTNILFCQNISIFSFLNLINVHNHGIAFGLLYNKQKWIVYTISVVNVLTIFTIIIVLIINQNIINNKIKIPYSFILGGALGNLYDRIHYGFIIDFIDIHIYNLHFATFNIADISIFTGSLLIILQIFKYYFKKNT